MYSEKLLRATTLCRMVTACLKLCTSKPVFGYFYYEFFLFDFLCNFSVMFCGLQRFLNISEANHDSVF